MKYLYLVVKSFQSNLVYRSALIWNLLLSGLSFVIQIGLWSALISSGVKKDITLQDMMFYIMLSKTIRTLTHSDIEAILEDQIKDGSVIMNFLRPISFKMYFFSTMAGNNLFGMAANTLPVLLVGAFILGVPGPADMTALLCSVLSVFFGILIMFELSFLVGLLAFWLQKTWYLHRYMTAGMTLFGGSALPLWFFPEGFNCISRLLPFRYVYFEAIDLYLGNTAQMDAVGSLVGSCVWFFFLFLAGVSAWRRVQKKITINGG